MLVLQIPPRTVKFSAQAIFPNRIELNVTLGPGSIFGDGQLDATLGVVATGTPVSLTPNLFHGGINHSSGGQLSRLILSSNLFGYQIEITGANVKLIAESGTEEDLKSLVHLSISLIPSFLSANACTAIAAEKAEGSVGSVAFNVEFVGEVSLPIYAVSSDLLADRFRGHFERLSRLLDGSERIFAAHRYLLQARRLREVSAYPGEFLGERILNFYKLLEALFSTRTVDTLRTKLDEIDTPGNIRDFLCSIIFVRDQLDSGHMALHPLKPNEYHLIHRFAHTAEAAATWILLRVTELAANESFHVGHSRPSDRTRLFTELEKRDRMIVEPFSPNPDPVRFEVPPVSFKKPRHKLRPNDPCSCGSGKKFKKCHGAGPGH